MNKDKDSPAPLAGVGVTVLPGRPGLAVAGTLLEVFRSKGISGPVPADLDPTPGLVKYLDAAKQQIVFAIFSLTSQPIADALIRAQKRGLQLRGLADNKQWGAVNDAVVKAGIDLERAVKQPACMHLKVAVIDGHIVALGSFNWTSNAELHNDEVLLVSDSQPLAQVLIAQIDAARAANK
jgi:phosphatidylserine/phosphatidylglycerophosphate/cardiolipin synthase-like enzyme